MIKPGDLVRAKKAQPEYGTETYNWYGRVICRMKNDYPDLGTVWQVEWLGMGDDTFVDTFCSNISEHSLIPINGREYFLHRLRYGSDD